jgi:RND superfamily putative drug exporter
VVVASLAALLPLGLMDARSVGLGGVLVVAAAVALALGLLPALLVLAAPWLDWPRLREPQAGRWQAWSHALLRSRWVVAPLALAGLVAMALPMWRFNPGVPDMRFYPPELESVRGVELLGMQGHRGWTDPIQVLVRRKDGGPILGPGGLGPMLDLSRAIHADPRVGEVLGPVDLAPGLTATHYAVLYARPEVAFQRHPGLGALVSRDRRSAVYQVITTDLVDVNGAMALTTAIRRLPTRGLQIQVGGLAALNLDYDQQLAQTLPGAIGWLLGATALILGLTFRAVLVPLKAIVLNLLVVGASIGTLVWVFQLGHLRGEGLGTLPTLIPMLVFCLTFGLSMDYEVFMIGRVREERREADGEEQAISRGLEATGGVIVAAAGIMVLVCGAFAGAHMIFVKLFGAGMAIAILLDVTVVRLVLAPALLAIAGRWNWWPGSR